MSRPKTPEGKRVTICARFSEAQAAEVDVARGTMSRSEWVRLAALAAALRLAALAAALRQQMPAGSIDRQAEVVRQNRRAANGPCLHPKARINKGLCGACGTYVGTKVKP